jgi:hypothetical protein
MQSLASGRDLESIEQQVESGCSGPPRTGSVRAELRFSGLPEKSSRSEMSSRPDRPPLG